VLRKIVAAIVLAPIAAVLIAFAIANRQGVVISFDPFDAAHPIYALATWLFVPIFVALIVGVLIGGLASWLAQGKWRRIARQFERELQALRGKLVALEGDAQTEARASQHADPSARLRLNAPVR